MICLQDTQMKECETRDLNEVFHGTIYHAATTSRSEGILIAIYKSVPLGLEESFLDE